MASEFFTFRKEVKYVIPLCKVLSIKECLDYILLRDDYCSDGIYSVRSLYFDTVNNIDFAEKLAGVSERKKIRIRIYNGDASLCKLELKEKKGDSQHKQSFLLTEDDAEMLIMCNYRVLKKYFEQAKASVKVYSIMEQGHYRPAVMIEYDRLAYKYPLYDTRITLDTNIKSTESNLNIFDSQINYLPILSEMAVLEIKYNGKLMGFLSDVLTQFHLTQSAYSKYCAGRKVYTEFNY